MACQLLFPTPVWCFELPERLDTGSFVNEIRRLQTEDPQGLQITNQGGWHSRTNLLDQPALASLFQWIAECSQEALTHLGWDFARAKPCFNNAWAMVNSRGHSIRAHLHPNSLFSGVIYLQAENKCGRIAFLDPRNGSQVLMPPLRDTHPGHLLQGRHELEPRTGLLVVFPAWLWHEAEPNESDHERICISFNIGMTTPPMEPTT